LDCTELGNYEVRRNFARAGGSLKGRFQCSCMAYMEMDLISGFSPNTRMASAAVKSFRVRMVMV